MSNKSEAIVREFCAAWHRRDIDEILDYFTKDAVYHNIPMPPAEGHDGIRQVLGMFVPPADSIEFEILKLAANDNVVFTERIDRFVMGGRTIELPVAGVFEISDGKIAAWRDYFDMQMFTQQAAG